jgi:hypothetical protein
MAWGRAERGGQLDRHVRVTPIFVVPVGGGELDTREGRGLGLTVRGPPHLR